MAHALDSARQKIARARDHLAELDSKTAKFVTDPPRFTNFVDDDGVGHVRFFHVPEVPSHLGLIVGDAVHNLRSSLDHLVFQLATHAEGTGETNGFPIYDDPAKYRSQQSRLLKDLPQEHRDRIESFQPYHIVCGIQPPAILPEFHDHMLLEVLARLDNLDKHRLLLPGTAVVPLREPSFKGVKFARGEWAGEGDWIRVAVGTELFTIEELEPLGDMSEVQLDPPPLFTLTFGEGDESTPQLWSDRTKGAVSRYDIGLMADAVERVLSAFEDAF